MKSISTAHSLACMVKITSRFYLRTTLSLSKESSVAYLAAREALNLSINLDFKVSTAVVLQQDSDPAYINPLQNVRFAESFNCVELFIQPDAPIKFQ